MDVLCISEAKSNKLVNILSLVDNKRTIFREISEENLKLSNHGAPLRDLRIRCPFCAHTDVNIHRSVSVSPFFLLPFPQDSAITRSCSYHDNTNQRDAWYMLL